MISAYTHGVRIRGVGAAVPKKVLTNEDLEKMMETTDEWIVQRTGIRRRHIADPATESELSLATDALRRALESAGMAASELDLIIHASVTAKMTCPSNACRISAALGAEPAGAFDLVAACSGFVYAINLADSLLRSGRHQAIGVIGCDVLTQAVDFSDRSVSILFGDGAGAAVLTRDDDPTVGCLYQALGADGTRWDSLYMPKKAEDVPEWDRENPIRLGCLRMSGRDIYKFAVTKFRELIEESLHEASLEVQDITHFICHQSNVRIIEAAKQRLGLPEDRVHINIDEYGNTSAGSVGLVLDELWQAGRVKRGDLVVMVAFGGGLTWASNVWKL